MIDTRTLSPDDIKSRIDLRDVFATFWGKPDRHNGHYVKYRSQWRNDENPDFTVYPDSFFDYSDPDVRGDVFTFFQHQLGIPFPEALQEAARFAGGEILADFTPRQHQPKDTPHEPPPAEWQQAVNKAFDQLPEKWNSPAGRKARLYLNERGISDDVIDRFSLLFNPNWLKTDYIDPDTGKPVSIAPGIVIPNRIDGVLWGVKVRDFHATLKGKYIHVKGSKPSAPFNADSLSPESPILICEGEFDALVAQNQLGDGWACITLGGASNDYARLPRRWRESIQAAPHIYACFDNDEPGQKAFGRLPESLNAKRVVLPDGVKDITEYIVQQGGDLLWLLRLADFFPAGLPNSWRTVLMTTTYFPRSVAPVVELLIEATRQALIGPDWTIPDVLAANQALGFNIPNRTVQNTLKTLDKVVYASRAYIESHKGILLAQTPKTGRRAEVYTLLPIQEMKVNILEWILPRIYEQCHGSDSHSPIAARMTTKMIEDGHPDADDPEAIAAEVNRISEPVYQVQNHRERFAEQRAQAEYARLKKSLDDVHSTPLPTGWPIGTGEDYRATFARAILEENPDHPGYTRQELARKLGLASKTSSAIKTTLKRAGAQSLEQFTYQPVTTAKNLNIQVRKHGKGGYAVGLVSIGPDGQKITHCYDPATAEKTVDTLLSVGCDVSIKYQIASKQVLVTDAPPAQRQHQPTIAPPEEKEPRRKAAPEVETRERHYGPTYDPEWYYQQLVLRCLHLYGYDKELTLDQGVRQCKEEGITADALLSQILKSPAEQVEIRPDPLRELLQFAVNELGGVILATG